MFYDEDMDDERLFIADMARRHKRGSKEEIQLFEELSLALELMQDDTFRVEGSRICDGLDFSIMTPYPDGLPYNVGTLFFNVDNAFDVKIKETPMHTNGIHNNYTETNFSIKIKKHCHFCNIR